MTTIRRGATAAERSRRRRCGSDSRRSERRRRWHRLIVFLLIVNRHPQSQALARPAAGPLAPAAAGESSARRRAGAGRRASSREPVEDRRRKTFRPPQPKVRIPSSSNQCRRSRKVRRISTASRGANRSRRPCWRRTRSYEPAPTTRSTASIDPQVTSATATIRARHLAGSLQERAPRASSSATHLMIRFPAQPHPDDVVSRTVSVRTGGTPGDQWRLGGAGDAVSGRHRVLFDSDRHELRAARRESSWCRTSVQHRQHRRSHPVARLDAGGDRPLHEGIRRRARARTSIPASASTRRSPALPGRTSSRVASSIRRGT